MKLTTLAFSLLAAFGAGCAVAPSANNVATADLPNCLDANFDAQQNLFTLKNAAPDAVNQQCALVVGARGSASRFQAGRYTVSLANGGGGGAGGTQQRGPGLGGGAGGGGAGAKETQLTVDLAEGVYKLTIGAGGPGGNACVFAPYYMSGGPGWAGSPSSIVRLPTGELIAGTPGADRYARPSRAAHEKSAGRMDGHGGSGPGQTTGGHGGAFETMTGATMVAQSGQDSGMTVAAKSGGVPGGNEDLSTAGGGGGATSRGEGGDGGGEKPGQAERPPERGVLGSGGGGGEGGRNECDAGARGGHGFIALRPN